MFDFQVYFFRTFQVLEKVQDFPGGVGTLTKGKNKLHIKQT